MSADELRRAAVAIREAYGPDADVDGWPEGDPFMVAVADWLDSCAVVLEVHPSATKHHAIKVATAYLGTTDA